ncbi:MAG TPA: NAD(P)-binding protein, partial [Syntrophales bacterium]|nr:NAD(P)-binding protein [Syntrophales bacterium]
MWKTMNLGEACVEPAVKQLLPPCQERCPINEDIQRTNVLMSLLPGDPEEAKAGLIQIGDYLFENNPLFPVCGFVCGICELACNYQSKGGAIRRRLLKRFLSDSYLDHLDHKKELDVIKDKGNVAVVGGGPGGLMCAFDLSKKGYRVTIFEATNRLGGA